MRSFGLTVVALALLSWVPSTARAADWATALPAGPACRLLDGNGVMAAVVPATAGAREPAAQLVVSLRACPKVKLASDQVSLGNLDGVGDADIIRRAAIFSFDTVVVVRSFDGERGPLALVAFYRKGRALGGYSAEAGVAPVEAAAAEAPTLGVSNAAADSVSSIIDKARSTAKDPKAAELEFDRRYIGFGRITLVNMYGVALGYLDQAYEGQTNRMPISLPEFYDKVGRHDLREKYDQRRKVWLGLTLPSGAVLVTGALLTAFGAREPFCSSLDPKPCPGRNYAMLGAGIGLDIIGVGAFVAGLVILPRRPPEEQMRQLADEHNRGLRKQLQLTGLSLAPRSDGLSLAATGRF